MQAYGFRNMINTETVFIIGAGASVAYGYPTSQKLNELILIEGISIIENFLTEKIGFEPPDIIIDYTIEFINKFKKVYDVDSIDWFLEKLSQEQYLQNIGRLLIVHFILESEKRHLELSSSGKTGSSDNWYQYLYKTLTNFKDNNADPKQILENKISFITFNYDRSLEYFMYDKFLSGHDFQRHHTSAKELLREIKPLHVYGKVANIYLNEDNETVGELGYGNYIPNYSLLDFLKKNIKLVMERKEVDTETMKEKIKNASRIYFLGFGFDDANLKILGIPEVLNKKQEILGTAFEKENGEIKLLRSKFLTKHNVKKTLFEPMTCLELLKNFPPDYDKKF